MFDPRPEIRMATRLRVIGSFDGGMLARSAYGGIAASAMAGLV